MAELDARTIHTKLVHVRQIAAKLIAHEIQPGFGCIWQCDCGESSICPVGASTLESVLKFAEQDYRLHCDRMHV
jgi:hypothetical protein